MGASALTGGGAGSPVAASRRVLLRAPHQYPVQGTWDRPDLSQFQRSALRAAEAQLARVAAVEGAEIGVRVNMVNPDAIFGTGLWSPEIREQRARAHGIDPAQVEEFYRKRNLPGVEVRTEDVAEAVLFLAADRSSRTTGAMIAVDGGIRDAFVR